MAGEPASSVGAYASCRAHGDEGAAETGASADACTCDAGHNGRAGVAAPSCRPLVAEAAEEAGTTGRTAVVGDTVQAAAPTTAAEGAIEMLLEKRLHATPSWSTGTRGTRVPAPGSIRTS